MKPATAQLLRKVVRNLFGILRAFEDWINAEVREPAAADSAERQGGHEAATRPGERPGSVR